LALASADAVIVVVVGAVVFVAAVVIVVVDIFDGFNACFVLSDGAHGLGRQLAMRSALFLHDNLQS